MNLSTITCGGMAHRPRSTDHPSQWSSRKSTQFDSKMSEQNIIQSPSPHAMYDIATLARIPREKAAKYPLTNQLPPLASAKEITPHLPNCS